MPEESRQEAPADLQKQRVDVLVSDRQSAVAIHGSWSRIHDARHASLTYACESAHIVEHRVFQKAGKLCGQAFNEQRIESTALDVDACRKQTSYIFKQGMVLAWLMLQDVPDGLPCVCIVLYCRGQM